MAAQYRSEHASNTDELRLPTNPEKQTRMKAQTFRFFLLGSVI